VSASESMGVGGATRASDAPNARNLAAIPSP
jgi:hypothetical protein